MAQYVLTQNLNAITTFLVCRLVSISYYLNIQLFGILLRWRNGAVEQWRCLQKVMKRTLQD